MGARPYWLPVLLGETDSGVYLGFTRGQWPIQAFNAELTHHLHWLAEDPDNRVLVGPVLIPEDANCYYAEKVPARVELVPFEGPQAVAG